RTPATTGPAVLEKIQRLAAPARVVGPKAGASGSPEVRSWSCSSSNFQLQPDSSEQVWWCPRERRQPWIPIFDYASTKKLKTGVRPFKDVEHRKPELFRVSPTTRWTLVAHEHDLNAALLLQKNRGSATIGAGDGND
ncbi:unnamed protein product, partial [Amoebophrya sp. A120]